MGSLEPKDVAEDYDWPFALLVLGLADGFLRPSWERFSSPPCDS